MLANYFLRVALIFVAVLSMVQPAQAGWSGTVYMYARCYGVPVSGNSWDNLLASISAACTLPYIYGSSTTLTGGDYSVGGTWTFTGSLSCIAPLVSNGLTCVEPPPPPPPPASCTAYPVASYIEFIGGLGNQPSQACVQNCLFNTGSGMSWGVAPNRQWQSSGRSTGEFCADNTAAAQSIDDPSCPAGEMLNASGVCTPLAMCPYDASIYAINVNCHPALCAADASLYASSPLCPAPAASAVPVVVDCAVTPNDPICAGAVSGVAPIVTGTPGVSGVYQAPTMAPLGISGGTQNGDVNIENCMMNSSGGVVCVGDTGGVELDAVADSVPLGDLTVNIGTITPVLVGSSGGCPAPSPMVLHGQTYYFDWTTYCNFAAWIKPLLLAFSWLAAAGILVGGFVA